MERQENRTRRKRARGPGGELPVDIAFRKIKEMMYHHELVPGQKLLYRELAKKLDMSITPVIQALNRLQFLNIVTYERNKGYYVGEANPTEIRELFAAREALETYLVPQIIEGLTEEKLRSIEAALKEHIQAASAPEYRRILMLKDSNFHLRMIEASGNRVFTSLTRMIFEQVYLKYRPEYMREKRIKEAAQEHMDLLAALRAKDAAKTRRLIRHHIRKGREHVVGSLWETPPPTLDLA